MSDARRTAHTTAISGLSCGSRDFNLVKHVFLNSPDLLQPDEFKEREKGDNYFDSGRSAAKQF